MKVKICGINSVSAFDNAVECGADLLGFVFFHRSPRYVTPRQAAALSKRHVGGPLRVGLFVDPSEDEIETVLERMHLDKLQLYAPHEICVSLGKKFNILVARAIAAEYPDDLPTTADNIDSLVIEAKPPAGATRPGGNATKLDWSICHNWIAPVPWLLAGGLTAENVAEAIALSNAPGVDVSSGVESLPGVKSPALIRRFMANARAAGLSK